MAATYDKLVVVTRKTRLQQLVERFNSKGQARFYIEHAGGDFADYAAEDDNYARSLDTLHKALDLGVRVQTFERAIVPTFLFAPSDLVVTVGQDGLVANVAKYAGAQPIVAVNPDPARFDGVLLPFRADGARAAVAAFTGGTAGTPPALTWEDPRLCFVVREPFASKQSGIRVTAGVIGPGQSLTIESHMPQGGVIFSDGVEADALAFDSGAVATIGAAAQRTRLVAA